MKIVDAIVATGIVLLVVLVGLFLCGFLARLVFAWLYLGWRVAQHIGL